MSEKEISQTVNDTCCGMEAKTLILGCSGGSNVGQIANNLMIELKKSGVGNAYCLAGVGAGLSGFLETAKSARTILIDDCPVACGKKVFENYDIYCTHAVFCRHGNGHREKPFLRRPEGRNDAGPELYKGKDRIRKYAAV